MSCIAKTPVVVPAGVNAKINGQVITTKDRDDELARTLNDAVEVKHVDNTLTFGSHDSYADGWVQAGTTRVLLSLMVIGVTEGFTKKLQLVGVGYRTAAKNNMADLSLGLSHPVDHQLPTGITAGCPTRIETALKGADKRMIDQVTADLHAYRRPEPCKGRGARHADGVARTKEAKEKQDNAMNKKSARIHHATRACRKLQELGVTRLVVHHTPRYIYVQVIAPNGSEVLVATSTIEKAIAEQLKYTSNKDTATAVGKVAAKRALKKDIKDVSFGHPRFQYHGRIQTLADAAREAGLQF